MQQHDNFIINGPADAPLTVVLAHGAGAGMDSPFMETIAQGLSSPDVRVIRFEFDYMRARRINGKRTAPDREPALIGSWCDVIESLGGGGRLAIGGKSLGGRVASMVADEAGVRGLVSLGYPFHPPGRPPGSRLTHLKSLKTPTLIVQGTRDSFGSKDEVKGYALSTQIRIAWIEDGDHSFKPRARSGRTADQNLDAAIEAVRSFIQSLPP